MKMPSLFRFFVLHLFISLVLGAGVACAFPPAPYYMIHGVVRDQVGQTVTAEGAEVILLRGGVEIGRTPITSNRIDQNYELNMRLDQNRSGTTFYSDKAVAAGGLFSLVVSMNGALFYPIEVSGNLTAGKGGSASSSTSRSARTRTRTACRIPGRPGSSIRPGFIRMKMATGISACSTRTATSTRTVRATCWNTSPAPSRAMPPKPLA
jgi:hypothetical protein